MGREKALLELDGRALLGYPLAALEGVASETWLASGATARFQDLGLRCVVDAMQEGGPLVGLVAGLDALRTPWLVVLACDMPRASSLVLARLLARAAAERLDVAMLATADGVEPLCAAYSAACAAPARAALERGERRMIAFHGASLSVRAFRADELGLGVDSADAAVNLNTPDDYQRELAARAPTPVPRACAQPQRPTRASVPSRSA